MGASDSRLDFYKYLPPPVRRELDALLLDRGEDISELHLKLGSGSSVIIGGERVNLSPTLSKSDIEGLLNHLTESSLYAYRDTISRGYIPIRGGVRVGIVGEARYDGGEMVGVSAVSALCFRIPTRESSFSRELSEAFSAAKSGLLIYSLPGAGKTSALRALAKKLGCVQGGKRVAVIDERLEFPTEDFLDTRVDLLRGYKKCDGLEIALRSLSPEVVMVDEIGSHAEAEAMLSYLNSGVKIVATAHAESYSSLFKKKNLRPFFEHEIFDAFAGLSREGNRFFCEVKINAS